LRQQHEERISILFCMLVNRLMTHGILVRGIVLAERGDADEEEWLDYVRAEWRRRFDPDDPAPTEQLRAAIRTAEKDQAAATHRH
jgi:hypothetical protein